MAFSKRIKLVYIVILLSTVGLIGCGESSNVTVSSFRHAEGGTHASHISADNTIAVVSTIVNGITV